MPVRLRYYQYNHIETEKVSIVWKVLHIFIFALIAINALCSAFAFNHIFDAFNYHCVLYTKPVFELENIKYHLVKTVGDEYEESTNATQFEIPVPVHRDDGTNPEDPGLIFKVPNVTDVIVKKGRLWVDNKTLTGQLSVDLRRTIYTDVLVCDWVLFAPLTTFVTAVFFAVLFLIFEKGGTGYQSDSLTNPTSILYPVLIVTAVMTLYSIAISKILHNGFKTFCSHFQRYTGQETCTKLMDLITVQRYFGTGHFYLMYRISVYSFVIGIILWVLQLILSILRIVCAADFQLTSILVRSKYPGDDLDEDAVHQAMLKTYPVLAQAIVVKDVARHKAMMRRPTMKGSKIGSIKETDSEPERRIPTEKRPKRNKNKLLHGKSEENEETGV